MRQANRCLLFIQLTYVAVNHTHECYTIRWSWNENENE